MSDFLGDMWDGLLRPFLCYAAAAVCVVVAIAIALGVTFHVACAWQIAANAHFGGETLQKAVFLTAIWIINFRLVDRVTRSDRK